MSHEQRVRLRVASLAVVLVSAAVACGLDDNAIEPLGQLDGSTDAHDEASAKVDGGAIDAGPCLTATTCDGDPNACAAGEICVPSIPAGWTLVGFDSPSSCGASYAVQNAIDLVNGGPAECPCSCNAGAAPSCANVQVVLATSAGCTATPTTESVAAACSNLAASYTVEGAFLSAHLQADPSTCSPSLNASTPAWDAGAVRECDFTGDAGSFCGAHATCVAASGANHKTCIKQAYSDALPPACGAACPNEYQSSCFAVADSVADDRSCTSCACAWSGPGCSAATVNGSDMSGCAGGSMHNTPFATDTCVAFSLASVSALGVTGTAGTPACQMTTAASANGTVSVNGEELVCCAN